MIWAGCRPWLLSFGLHSLVGAVILGALLIPSPRTLPAIRMRLVETGARSQVPGLTNTVSLPESTPPATHSEPGMPSWKEEHAGPVSMPEGVPAPASLDDLLPPAASEKPTTFPGTPGWSSPLGQGYAPPPLPPPDLAPPQGARWTLVFSVPGGGGLASHVEGLDSGHPDLDRWLERYLRTVSFPSGLDGQDYQVKWELRLDSGRPQ